MNPTSLSFSLHHRLHLLHPFPSTKFRRILFPLLDTRLAKCGIQQERLELELEIKRRVTFRIHS